MTQQQKMSADTILSTLRTIGVGVCTAAICGIYVEMRETTDLAKAHEIKIMELKEEVNTHNERERNEYLDHEKRIRNIENGKSESSN
jgi:SUMO ligase MMS21 Smc5/6 complex component